MRFAIRHEMTFHYCRPVFLEPMTLRLRPASDAAGQCVSFRLALDPQPTGLSWIRDAYDNAVATVWFEALLETLHVTAESEVVTTLGDPFAFLVTDPDAMMLPWSGAPACLKPACIRTDHDPAIDALAKELMHQSDGQTLRFLMALTSHLHRAITWVERLEGDAWSASTTLREGQGACRDLAVLFMEVCRSVGLPARYVSGYHLIEPEQPSPPHLHAWAEVYLPGAGWRGYDPSCGLAATDRHVRLASGIHPHDTMASEGNYRGTGVSSSLTAAIAWKLLEG